VRRVAAVLALVLALAACGGSESGTIAHPGGAGELVLRVATGGGLVPPDFRFRELPWLSLYGDGTLVTVGPQIEIYPAPALPNLLATPVTEAGVQAILGAARDAGLLGPDASYTTSQVADGTETTFSVVAAGRRHVVSVYALVEDPAPAGASAQELEARKELAALEERLFDLRSWLPAGAIGEETSYVFTELRILVQPYRESEQDLVEPEQTWPLVEPLASFGEPVPDLAGARCGVVRGADLDLLLPALRAANQLTPWTSGGERYALVLRPLLPDEHGC